MPVPTVALAALALAAALPAAAGDGRPLALETGLVALDAERPTRRHVDRLEWRGGLVIESPEPAFGGLSGLMVSADGGEMTAVGDTGVWVSARLQRGAGGRLAALSDGVIGELHGPDGAPLAGKAWRDAEALAALPDGGALVAFEHEHRLWRYPPGEAPLAGRPRAVPPPEGLAAAPRNAGAEALAALADGRLVVFLQGIGDGRDRRGFLRQDGAWHPLSLARLDDMEPSGAAQLPGGDLVVLERRPGWGVPFAARLRRIPLAAVRPGARLEGEVLALLEAPLAVDNMEGLAAARGPDGETLIYLVSDDNFADDQRTLLLAFALAR